MIENLFGVLLIISMLGILISIYVNSYSLFKIFFALIISSIIAFLVLKGISLIQEIKTENILPKEEYSEKEVNIVNKGTLNLYIIENAKM